MQVHHALRLLLHAYDFIDVAKPLIVLKHYEAYFLIVLYQSKSPVAHINLLRQPL